MLKTKRPRLEKYKKSLAYHGPKKWNALPEDIQHETDKHLYKRMVCNWVGMKAISDSSSNPVKGTVQAV